MPTPEKPTPSKPPQQKPMWEYAVGGVLWGAGFFGAALILRKLFPTEPTEVELDDVESW
jgi:hypothetical protein